MMDDDQADGMEKIASEINLETQPELQDLEFTTRRSSNVADMSDQLNETRLNRYILGIAVLNFDLEVGQSISFTQPADLQLTDIEKSNIQFSCFPDTSIQMGDTVFSFRSRRSSLSQDAGDMHANSQFIHGYVMFRQQRDKTLKRGFLQKSVAILSQWAYPGLFLRMVAILGQQYFSVVHPIHSDILNNDGAEQPQLYVSSQFDGRQLLMRACQQIASWPRPRSGEVMDLPFCGVCLQVELPTHNQAQLLESSGFVKLHKITSPSSAVDPNRDATGGRGAQSRSLEWRTEQILASIPSTLVYPTGFLGYSANSTSKTANRDLTGSSLGMFYRFKEVLDELWTLWELVLLNERIVVMGQSPAVCSEAVHWLTRIIAPIAYRSDYRPYLTIQDADFKTFIDQYKNPQDCSPRPQRHQVQRDRAVSSPTTPSTASQQYVFGKQSSDHYPTGKSSMILVGVTNPFFTKSSSHWPHVLRLGDLHEDRASISKQELAGKSSRFSSESILHFARSNSPTQLFRSVSPTRARMRKLSMSMDFTTGLTTQHKPYFARNKKMIAALRQAYENGDFINGAVTVDGQQRKYKGYVLNETLRRHFVDLTEKFLAPLNRYFITLIPLCPDIVSFNGNLISMQHGMTDFSYYPPHSLSSFIIEPFCKNRFTEQLLENGPPQNLQFVKKFFPKSPLMGQSDSSRLFDLPLNKSWAEIYIRFLECDHFIAWLTDQKRLAEAQLRSRYLESLCSIDVHSQKVNFMFSLFLICQRELSWAGTSALDVVQNHFVMSSMPPTPVMSRSNVSLSNSQYSQFVVADHTQSLKIVALVKQIWSLLPQNLRDLLINGPLDYICEKKPSQADCVPVVIQG